MSSIFSQDVKQRKHLSSTWVHAEISVRPFSECGFSFTSVKFGIACMKSLIWNSQIDKENFSKNVIIFHTFPPFTFLKLYFRGLNDSSNSKITWVIIHYWLVSPETSHNLSSQRHYYPYQSVWCLEWRPSKTVWLSICLHNTALIRISE